MGQFNAAVLERAPEKLVGLIAADCVMEGTGLAPDGNVRDRAATTMENDRCRN
jgi:hypothetical protein